MRGLLLVTALTPSFALAQDAAPAAAGSPLAGMLPLVLIFFVFYFLIIKPQQKRVKEHQAVLMALKKGDEVVTGGGILGKITKVDAGDKVTVEIAKGLEVVVLKSTLSGLVSAPKAVEAAAAKKSSGNKNDNAVPSRDSVANDN